MVISHTRIPLKAKFCDVYIAHQYCDDEYLCGLNQIFLLETCYFQKHNTNTTTTAHNVTQVLIEQGHCWVLSVVILRFGCFRFFLCI